MTNTLNQPPIMETALPTAVPGVPSGVKNLGGMTCLRESLTGLRTLCLTPMRNEARLGDPLIADPWLEETVAPLVARFAALVFAEQETMIEPLLQQLRWVAYEHGIDHIALPLWPETQLAQRMLAIATDLGMPANFVLMQDETNWPDSHIGMPAISDLQVGALYA